jgi:hypothetical protein
MSRTISPGTDWSVLTPVELVARPFAVKPSVPSGRLKFEAALQSSNADFVQLLGAGVALAVGGVQMAVSGSGKRGAGWSGNGVLQFDSVLGTQWPVPISSLVLTL